MHIEHKTHEVFNQFSELKDYNLYSTDAVLKEYFHRHDLNEEDKELEVIGHELGSAGAFRAGALANMYVPVLHAFDDRGRRTDFVEFHPAWHRFMAYCKIYGLIGRPFENQDKGRWAFSAAVFMMQTQVEAGALCPATMTLSCIPVLQREDALWQRLGEKLISREYDPRDLPIEQKHSIWIGMGVTEKQGGSDVRANTTKATAVGASGRGMEYRITGHKWFFSAPMSDAHLVVAKTTDTDEICCFYVPRWKPDGTKNPLHIQRLKDKLGNRSNSSCEVEFHDAYGIMIGEEGRGIPTIMEMANHTRFCCVLGSAGIMRQAMVQAIAYARKRIAFGKPLSEQPLMRSVLVDLALEAEAAQQVALRLAEAFEAGHPDAKGRAWQRFVTPAAKYWVCKRAEAVTAEAMEVFGGNGYIEDGDAIMARLYKEAPVNSIWEGSGNVMCLDVLRVLNKNPEWVGNVITELQEIAKASAPVEAALSDWKNHIRSTPEKLESQGRLITEKWMLIVQACLMLKYSPGFMSRAFIQLRFSGGTSVQFGAINTSDIDVNAILERAFPNSENPK